MILTMILSVAALVVSVATLILVTINSIKQQNTLNLLKQYICDNRLEAIDKIKKLDARVFMLESDKPQQTTSATDVKPKRVRTNKPQKRNDA